MAALRSPVGAGKKMQLSERTSDVPTEGQVSAPATCCRSTRDSRFPRSNYMASLAAEVPLSWQTFPTGDRSSLWVLGADRSWGEAPALVVVLGAAVGGEVALLH